MALLVTAQQSGDGLQRHHADCMLMLNAFENPDC